MNKTLSNSNFKLLFIGIVALDILVGSFTFSEYRWVTKPLILLSLLVYFALNGKQLSKATYILMLLALLCSLSGDIFLLFDSKANASFIVGLLFFLMAHLLYGTVFLKKRNNHPPLYSYGALMMLFAIAMMLFFYISDGLGALTYPVIVYIIGILFMAVTSVLRIKKVSTSSFLWVFIGALFFVASDSILAINMFKFDVPLSNIWIMGSYAAAQYLIVAGILTQNNVPKI